MFHTFPTGKLMKQTPTVGLVMSGGGIRGLAHVGVLQVLREHNIHISHYAGSSAGALVGVLAASDCSIEQMLEFWTESNPFHIRHLALGQSGLFNPLTYIKRLKEFVPYDSFEELPATLTVAVTAMLEGRAHYASKGELWPLVLASATYPFVFSPIQYEGEIYMDGGITDNFPSQTIRERCDVLLGINVSPSRQLAMEDMGGVRDIVERIMDLQFGVKMDQKDELCDLMVVPQYLEAYGAFDTEGALKIYEQGLDAGREALPAIQRLLEEFSQNPSPEA